MEYEIQSRYYDKWKNYRENLAFFVDLVVKVHSELEYDRTDNESDFLDTDNVNESDCHGYPYNSVFFFK